MIAAARAGRTFASMALALAVLASVPRSAVGQAVEIRDVGPGRAGRWLRDDLRAAHVLLRSDSANPISLRRDTTYATNVIVVGGPATVASNVNGDVIVVGGDLFLHPGVNITGRAVAIGGGVYPTSLGRVGAGIYPNREFTYRVTKLVTGAIALDYTPIGRRDLRVVTLPGFYGVRIPTYDRADGLSFPVGPTLSFDTARIEVDLLGTYRSQLGVVDPSTELRASIGRRLDLTVRGGRTTLSNDRWIYSDLTNSLMTLGTGNDARNYYRADRVDGQLSYRIEGATTTTTLTVGALDERAWSVRPDSGAQGGPWSFFGRRGRQEMLRPNPPIDRGIIASGLAGAAFEWSDQGVAATLDANVELPWTAPRNRRFVQTTLDATSAFPTFGVQHVEFESHAVLTTGDTAPRQRFAYLGGSGTLPTFDLLQFGGDELLFIEGRYVIPLDNIQLSVLGAPTVTLRYITGAAGVGHLPPLEQNVGARVAVSLLRIDYVIDPASRRSRFGVGISLFR